MLLPWRAPVQQQMNRLSGSIVQLCDDEKPAVPSDIVALPVVRRRHSSLKQRFGRPGYERSSRPAHSRRHQFFVRSKAVKLFPIRSPSRHCAAANRDLPLSTKLRKRTNVDFIAPRFVRSVGYPSSISRPLDGSKRWATSTFPLTLTSHPDARYSPGDSPGPSSVSRWDSRLSSSEPSQRAGTPPSDKNRNCLLVSPVVGFPVRRNRGTM